jgi:dTDP-4-dehydrorhamnose reductase
MNDFKILLFGRNGQLGWELQRTLAPLGNLTAVDQEDLDLVNQAELRSLILDEKPHLIVNAAAYTNVDVAESIQDIAFAINQTAPGTMACTCKMIGAALVHYSTDYVFNGRKGELYTELDEADPINTYGRSKRAGEIAVIESGIEYLIFRTSWVYSFRRPSFPLNVLEWAQTKDSLRIVVDQIGSPTWARMLAVSTAHVLAMGHSDLKGWIKEKCGLYHLAGVGACSRYELAIRTLEMYEAATGKKHADVLPATSDEFPSTARRPGFSALDCSKFKRTFGLQLPSWQDSLCLAMEAHFGKELRTIRP